MEETMKETEPVQEIEAMGKLLDMPYHSSLRNDILLELIFGLTHHLKEQGFPEPKVSLVTQMMRDMFNEFRKDDSWPSLEDGFATFKTKMADLTRSTVETPLIVDEVAIVTTYLSRTLFRFFTAYAYASTAAPKTQTKEIGCVVDVPPAALPPLSEGSEN